MNIRIGSMYNNYKGRLVAGIIVVVLIIVVVIFMVVSAVAPVVAMVRPREFGIVETVLAPCVLFVGSLLERIVTSSPSVPPKLE